MNQIVKKRQDGILAAETTRIAIALKRQHKNILKSVRRLKNNPGWANDFIETAYKDCNGKTQTSYWVTKKGFVQLTKHIPNIDAEKSAILAQYGQDAAEPQAIDLFGEGFESATPLDCSTVVPDDITIKVSDLQERMSGIEAKLDIIIAAINAAAKQKPASPEYPPIKLSNEPVSVSELAKMLCQSGVQIGEMRLFQWMRDKQYLCSVGSDYNLPRQKYVEQGLFVIRTSRVQLTPGRIVEKSTTKVTTKGQEYFINKFLYTLANQ